MWEHMLQANRQFVMSRFFYCLILMFLSACGPVTSLTFSQDGRSLISAGEDGVIRIWGLP